MIIRIVFIALFLVAGTLCHEPWKQDETYSFGIIYHFYMTHSWLVPMNAEIFFMEKPPLYYWTAVALCHALSGMLALHDAARLASTLYTLIALAFITKAAKLLYPENPKAAPHAALLLLSTLGILRHCHDLFTDVALLAGACITLYGIGLLALQNKEWWRAGSWSGLGIGVAFLSKGLFFP